MLKKVYNLKKSLQNEYLGGIAGLYPVTIILEDFYAYKVLEIMDHISYEYEKNLVAFCGLYCRECVYYKNVFRIRAKDLLSEVEKNEWIKNVWESLDAPFDADDFITQLTWLASSPGCPGCRAGAGWPECPIRKCAQEKNLQGCFDCSEYPCQAVSGEQAAYQRELIEKIKEAGLEDYIKMNRGEIPE